jgi:hypothetical protein
MVSANTPPAAPSEPWLASDRELVVVVRPEVGAGLAAGDLASATGVDGASLQRLLEAEDATLEPLFGGAGPDQAVFYTVEAAGEKLDRLAARLQESDLVAAAYVKPPAELFLSPEHDHNLALLDEPPSQTPDLTGQQGYLEPAPEGIDARHAWTVPGGTGAGVQIIDVDAGWRFAHEDLQHQGGVAGGTPNDTVAARNQGTNAIGVLSADENGLGVTGICPDAEVRGVSFAGKGLSSARAIRHAADLLGPGDILLVMLHRRGPRGTNQNSQQGFIPVEWWEDDFQAIRYAVDKGVIVVEPAGDGDENLDDPVYESPKDGFPAGWTNPFNRANRDSGAIVVGAGFPPREGTALTGPAAPSPTGARWSTRRAGAGRWPRPAATSPTPGTCRAGLTRTASTAKASRGRRAPRRW